MDETPTNTRPKAISWMKMYRRTLFSTLAAALGSLSMGAAFGYSAVIVPDINSTPGQFHLSAIEVSFVVSIQALAGLLGGPISGVFLDRSGRKFTILCSAVPFTIGWLLVAAAPNVYCLCVGRFIIGICMSLMNVSVPVYVTEISSPSIRGLMGSFHELFTNIGILYAYAFGTFLTWKWLAVVCQAIIALMIVCMLFVPESPRWLMKDERKEECLKALTWLRSADEDINLEMNELEENVKAVKLTMFELKEFLNPDVYRPLFIVMGIMTFQQLTGYGVVPQYMVTILQKAGSKWHSFSLTAIIGAAGVISNGLSAIFVDRVGRRVMLLVSASLMTLCLAGLSIYFSLLELYPTMDVSENYSMVAFVCVLLYIMSVALGFGPVPFYLASELLPLKVRGKAGGVVNFTLCVFIFSICFSFPLLVNAIGYFAVFWLMTGFGLLSMAFSYFVVPETKGLSLETIENTFKY